MTKKLTIFVAILAIFASAAATTATAGKKAHRDTPAYTQTLFANGTMKTFVSSQTLSNPSVLLGVVHNGSYLDSFAVNGSTCKRAFADEQVTILVKTCGSPTYNVRANYASFDSSSQTIVLHYQGIG